MQLNGLAETCLIHLGGPEQVENANDHLPWPLLNPVHKASDSRP